MVAKALQLMFFWRRNNVPSIAFKSAFWGLVAWFAVGMFTNVRLALIAAAVIAGMSAIKYALHARKQTRKLMQMCDGDLEKLAALQAKLNTPGMAGNLMREMLNAEMDDDDEHEDDAPLSEEQRKVNIDTSTLLIQKMITLTRQAELSTDAECQEIERTLLEEYASGDYPLELADVIAACLPDNTLSVYTEDYINEDDHAALVEEFSAATNGCWVIEDCTSSYDEEADDWVVSFKDEGKVKTWRFKQQRDELNENFFHQVINYTQSRSGYTVTILDNDEAISLVCLPQGMYDALNEGMAAQAA